jgi:hypothetical protein
MAAALLSLSPLWSNSLRIWLASTLVIGIMLWAGRSQVLGLALVMAVLFVNENDFTPARSTGQLVAGALIGILTAIVLHEISTSWVVLGLAILITGVLVRSLGLLKGLSTGYLSCWAVELMHRGNQFNWAMIFDLAFAAVVGILMAQIATWALWPPRPLQQLRDQNQGRPMPAHTQHRLSRWAQAGSIWRQVLRQWLLLEPLLRQLDTPLPAGSPQPLLRSALASLARTLQTQPTAAPAPILSSPAQDWLEEAGRLVAPQPLLLAIGQQCHVLKQLLHSRALLSAGLAQFSASKG